MTGFLFGLLAFAMVLILWANLQPSIILRLFVNVGRKASGLQYKEIQVDDIVWPYLESTPNNARVGTPVLVFVHGFASDKDSWTLYTRQFYKEYRIIAMDLPGHGQSVKNLDRDYGIQAQTDRLAKFLQALKIDRCHMIGNSMGGHITLNFAVKYPDMLDSIALINNAGVLLEEKTEIELAVEAGNNPLEMKSPEDVVRQMGLVMYKPMHIPGVLKRAMYQRAKEDKLVLDRIFWTLVEQADATAMNDQLSSVCVPTCVIWGRHDRIIDVSTLTMLVSKIRDTTSVIIEETGHVPMLEKPVETAQHHKAFLDTRKAA